MTRALLLFIIAIYCHAVEFSTNSLMTEIDSMIESLKSVTPETAKGFVDIYADPDELHRLKKEDGEMDADFGKMFVEEKVPRLLNCLQLAKEAAPIVSDENKTITFTVAGAPKGRLAFIFKNDRWYLLN